MYTQKSIISEKSSNIFNLLGLIFYFQLGLTFFFRPKLLLFSYWCGDSPSRANFTSIYIRVRGVPARDISALRVRRERALTRSENSLSSSRDRREKWCLAYAKRYFSEEMCVWLKPDARFSKKRVFGLSQTHRFGEGPRNIYIYIYIYI